MNRKEWREWRRQQRLGFIARGAEPVERSYRVRLGSVYRGYHKEAVECWNAAVVCWRKTLRDRQNMEVRSAYIRDQLECVKWNRTRTAGATSFSVYGPDGLYCI